MVWRIAGSADTIKGDCAKDAMENPRDHAVEKRVSSASDRVPGRNEAPAGCIRLLIPSDDLRHPEASVVTSACNIREDAVRTGFTW